MGKRHYILKYSAHCGGAIHSKGRLDFAWSFERYASRNSRNSMLTIYQKIPTHIYIYRCLRDFSAQFRGCSQSHSLVELFMKFPLFYNKSRNIEMHFPSRVGQTNFSLISQNFAIGRSLESHKWEKSHFHCCSQNSENHSWTELPRYTARWEH